jgi:hypothetical protein
MTAPCASFAGKERQIQLAASVPDSVAILGLGPSLEAYVDVTKRFGNRRVMFDEVWAINAAADVIQCDRVFHMDDVRIQEMRAKRRAEHQAAARARLASGDEITDAERDEIEVTLAPDNIGPMLEWLRAHPGPVYTSRSHPDYPGLIDYPLADVMNSCGGVAYFNSTAAYAVAFAIHIGVKKITLFGCDFSYANSHQAEQGRACVEFYLGIAKERGIAIGLPNTTPLMDGIATNQGRFYGYDTLDIALNHETEDGPLLVTFTPRKTLPTADEIESRYDHSKHPNALVRAQQDKGA